MSDNHWKTQPRLQNGEFTFRGKIDFWKKVLQKLEVQIPKNSISHQTKGGSYGSLRKETYGNKNVEIHHMPADSVSPLSKWKGPCIIMDKDDHHLTCSFGHTQNANEYRRTQKTLIDQGKFLDAEIMDIRSIVKTSGSKYVKSMIQKLDYDIELYKKGVING